MVAEILEGIHQRCLWWEAWGKVVVHHRHVCEIEAPRCAGIQVVVVHGKVAVAVGVGT